MQQARCIYTHLTAGELRGVLLCFIVSVFVLLALFMCGANLCMGALWVLLRFALTVFYIQLYTITSSLSQHHQV